MMILLMIGGLVFLVVGAEFLVRGASQLAAALGVPSLIIGLTVVAFGTSAPELAVSIESALSGEADIALGNVVGSNICNILFILGLSALVTPLVVSKQLIRVDVPFMIGVSCLLYFLQWDGHLTRLDGVVLTTGLFIYTGLQVVLGRKGDGELEDILGDEVAGTGRGWLVLKRIVYLVGGFGMLVVGARWLVEGAVEMARYLEFSEAVIGLTIVAAGTSMPEAVTSVVASIRGERDIAVGNIVGSNLFNILSVLGIASLVAPAPIAIPETMLSFDMPVMLAVAFVCMPIFFTGGVITRWEGGILFAYYFAYTIYLILAAQEHERLATYGAAMTYFVIPITCLTLLVLFLRAMRMSPEVVE